MPTPLDIAGDTALSVSSKAVSTAIPGEAVILDPASGRYFGLDGVGARTWELLHGSTTLAQLVETLAAEYDVDASTCERDVRLLLADLRARGLIELGGPAHDASA
jgi:hypothetical protein